MKKLLLTSALTILGQCLAPLASLGQAVPPPTTEAEFDAKNAVIDTSIPFAIGAREAQQTLRGAFGWDTFQEGLVEGVYFRFDPDGYARFSTSPRLDTDVFEVICRPRTLSCMARKEGLSIILDNRGRILLKFDQIVAGDTVFVSEGVSDLQLPDRILQPLDARLETLLTAGGELIVRRDTMDVAIVSLQGFAAVVSYLRWVAARQDYSILPRDWPVPNSALTPAPTPPEATVGWMLPGQNPLRSAQPSGVAVASQGSAPRSGVADVERLSSEIENLRQVLLQQSSDQQSLLNNSFSETGEVQDRLLSDSALDTASVSRLPDVLLENRIARIEASIESIWDEIRRLDLEGSAANSSQNEAVEEAAGLNDVPRRDQEILERLALSLQNLTGLPTPVPQTTASPAPIVPTSTAEKFAENTIQRISEELGISKSSASMLVTLLDASTSPQSVGPVDAPQVITDSQTSALLSDKMVQKIISDLENDARQQPAIAALAESPTDADQPQPNALRTQTYLKLADYLNLVLAGAEK